MARDTRRHGNVTVVSQAARPATRRSLAVRFSAT
jgi:hypothetical protein